MAKSLFKKPKAAMKGAGKVLVHSAVRNATGVGSMYLANMFTAEKNPQIRKWGGLGALGLGMGLEIFAEDSYLQSIGQGIQFAGSLETAGRLLLPKEAEKFGLKKLPGIGEETSGEQGAGTSGMGAAAKETKMVEGSPSWEWLTAAAAQNAAKVMDGLGCPTEEIEYQPGASPETVYTANKLDSMV